MALVLDASVALAWFVHKQATPYTDRIRRLAKREELHVPSVWRLEVVNAVLMLARRGNLTEEAADTCVALLSELEVTVHEDAQPLADLLSLARRHDLSAYDASYLALAAELRMPLACKDRALRDALPKAGVKLA